MLEKASEKDKQLISVRRLFRFYFYYIGPSLSGTLVIVLKSSPFTFYMLSIKGRGVEFLTFVMTCKSTHEKGQGEGLSTLKWFKCKM